MEVKTLISPDLLNLQQPAIKQTVDGGGGENVVTANTTVSTSDTLTISSEAIALYEADATASTDTVQQTDGGTGVEPPATETQADGGTGVEPPVAQTFGGTGVEPPKTEKPE